MRSTKQTRRDAKSLFRSAMVNGVMDDNRVRDLMRRVLEGKPRGFMGILNYFQRLVKLELERRTARIETAMPLDAAAQEGLKKRLTELYGPGLEIIFQQNPALIGGMKIQVGSDVYNNSIRSRLDTLQEQFSS